MDTPTADGRQSATKALLRGVALLSLALAATAPAAPCAASSCDSPGSDRANMLLNVWTLRSVDLGGAGTADSTAEPGATTESLAPLLFLTPRVSSILEDVFQAEAGAPAAEAVADAAAGEEAAPEALLRSPVAETDGVSEAHGPSAETDHTSILPKFQRQMYRTDI